LTVFFTPEGDPFYGGTYFPPEARHGRPAFADLLRSIAETWRERPAEISGHAEAFRRGYLELDDAFEDASARAKALLSTDAVAARSEALRRVLDRADRVHGGLAGAPKFPSVPLWRWVADLAVDPGLDGALRNEADAALVRWLDRMARGGIYDQVRGGFARYSTDREWVVPHFEKMLCDNALSLRVYAERGASLCWDDVGAGSDTRAEGLPSRAEQLHVCARIVRETARYLLDEMRGADGR